MKKIKRIIIKREAFKTSGERKTRKRREKGR